MNEQKRADLKKENDILKNRVEILEDEIRELMERDVFVQREKCGRWANTETSVVYNYLVNNRRHFCSKLDPNLQFPLQIKEYLTDVFDDTVRMPLLFNVSWGYYLIRDLFYHTLDKVDLVELADAIEENEHEWGI